MKTSYIVLIVFTIILIIVLSVLGGLGYLDSSSKTKKDNCKCYYLDPKDKNPFKNTKYNYYYKKNKKECADSCNNDNIFKDHIFKYKYCFEDEPCVSTPLLPPTSHTQAPTSHTQAPTSHTQAPTSHTQAPTSHTQAPTSHTQAPTSTTDNNKCECYFTLGDSTSQTDNNTIKNSDDCKQYCEEKSGSISTPRSCLTNYTYNNKNHDYIKEKNGLCGCDGAPDSANWCNYGVNSSFCNGLLNMQYGSSAFPCKYYKQSQ